MKWLTILAVIPFSTPVVGQESIDVPALVEGLNEHVGGWTDYTTDTDPPEWGVAIKNSRGETVDLFGQVPYSINPTGGVTIPGFRPPPDTYLELVPAREYALTALALATAEDVDPTFGPITAIPSVVEKATDYLANSLCAMKGRPSSITLTIMVGASGSIFFAEASTEAGSEVMWDFASDVCPRYGYSSAISP